MKRSIRKKLVLWLIPAVFGLLLVLLDPVGAEDGKLEELLRRGDELYCTHHLAPGRLDEAIRCYEQALGLKPTEYAILWKLAEMHQIYGMILGEQEKAKKEALWGKGAEYGKRAVEVFPAGKEGHFYYMANMGALARERGALQSVWKFRKIRQELDRTLEIDPDYAPALVAKAQYLTEMPGLLGGSDEEAARLYERALRADPDYGIARYYQAELDARKGRYEQALARIREILVPPQTDCIANWATIDRPWAEKLLKEIQAKTSR